MYNLTTEDCKTIIKMRLKTSNFEVLSHETEPISNNMNGFMNGHFQIKINVKISNKNTTYKFIGKATPPQQSLQSQFVLQSQSNTKEAYIYNYLLRDLIQIARDTDKNMPLWCPESYLARPDILVIEDLSAKHYTTVDQLKTFDYNHVVLLLKTLARMHASSLILEEQKSKEIGKKWRLNQYYQGAFHESLYKFDNDKFLGKMLIDAANRGMHSVVHVLPESCISITDVVKKIDEIHAKLAEFVKPSEQFRNATCHGDLWCNNVLFNYENGLPKECCFLDFQLVRYNPPAHDVMSALYLTTSATFRHKYQDEVIEIYYTALGEAISKAGFNIESILPSYEFQASCSYLRPLAKYQSVFYLQMTTLTGDATEKIVSDKEEMFKSFYVDSSEAIINSYSTDPVYRSRCIETMNEIRLEADEKNGICREDCVTILKRALNTAKFELNDYNVDSLDDKEMTGYLGEHFKLQLSYKLNKSIEHLSLFVKRIPRTQSLLEFTNSTGAFKKEPGFFNMLHEKLTKQVTADTYKWMPQFFLSRADNIIVLEDLTTKGYRSVGRYDCINYDHCLVMLKTLSKMHAASIMLEERTSKLTGSNYCLLDQYSDILQEGFFARDIGAKTIQSVTNGMITVADHLPKEQFLKEDIDKFKEKAPGIFSSIYDLLKPSKSYRNVVCHGDLWSTNMLFLYEKGVPLECCLVDFQMIRYNPPAHDLLCFLNIAVEKKIRDEYYGEFLQIYYTLLGNELQNGGYDIDCLMPLSIFLDSCRYYSKMAKIIAAIYVPFINVKSKIMVDVIKDNETADHQWYVDRSDLLLRSYHDDDVYRKRMIDVMEDLFEICV